MLVQGQGCWEDAMHLAVGGLLRGMQRKYNSCYHISVTFTHQTWERHGRRD